jgi:hypothetical protein
VQHGLQPPNHTIHCTLPNLSPTIQYRFVRQPFCVLHRNVLFFLKTYTSAPTTNEKSVVSGKFINNALVITTLWKVNNVPQAHVDILSPNCGPVGWRKSILQDACREQLRAMNTMAHIISKPNVPCDVLLQFPPST